MATSGRTPKRALSNIVIDIGSSPDPEPRGRTRSTSRTRAIASHGNAKGKGKGNASSQTNNLVGKRALGPVIELTDSESETTPVKSNRNEKKSQQNQAQAGPSRPKPFPMMRPGSSNSLLLPTVPARASLENIPSASSSNPSRKRKDRDTASLFLPSDEENEPPSLDADPGPSQNRAGLQGQGVDPLPIDDGWGQERQPRPLQNDHDGNGQPSVAPARHTPEAPIPAVLPTPNDDVQGLNPVERVPEPENDSTSQAVAQVLEIIPDVEPDYVLGLVITHLPNFATQTPEHVLGLLFEDGGYPRIDKKGKRKAVESANETDNGDGLPNKKVKIDYAAVDRPFTGGSMYEELALVQLQISFPFIPKAYLRRSLQENSGFYVPTHLAVAAMEKRYHNVALGPRPYVMKATRYHPKKDLKKYLAVTDEAFAQERRWLVDHLQDPNETNAETVGAPIIDNELDGKGKGKSIELEEEEEPLEEGTGIECQCCFSEYAFDKMVQCPETHLFCSSCVSQYAATKLGEHDPSIVCMHPSGCAQPFPASELRRVLSTKLMELYERVKQQKEIQEASLEGLEECPFCEWKCVIETPVEQEKLFRCGNEEGGCGEVSCRLCKKKDHLPKSCKEVEEDKLLDGRHAIEEAMTRALMRNCPKCHKAFVKEAGCNKMTCPNCRTLSCYVCRKVITGYEHFNQAPPGRATTSRSGGKCLLWDNVEERHATEVKAAAEKAAADYKRDHPYVDDKDIKVDIPAAPKPPPLPDPRLNRQMLQPGPHVQWDQALVPLNFGVPNQNPFLPVPDLPQLQAAARQRRYPIRGQHQQQILQAQLEQRYLEQQRLMEEQRMEIRLEQERLREQERQQAIQQHEENQRFYNRLYQQQRIRVEQEQLQQQAIRNHREARVQHRDALHQQAQQLHLQAQQQAQLAAQQQAQANVHGHGHVHGQPQRALRHVVPAPPVHGAAGGRRRRRG